jgi:hypothetical protein
MREGGPRSAWRRRPRVALPVSTPLSWRLTSRKSSVGLLVNFALLALPHLPSSHSSR